PKLDVRWSTAALRTATWEATRAAFGRVLEPRYHFANADVVLVLDGDPFARGPAWLRWARHFADRRRTPSARQTRDQTEGQPRDPMSRAYVVEPYLTPTGLTSDHRLPVRRSEVGVVAAAILAA